MIEGSALLKGSLHMTHLNRCKKVKAMKKSEKTSAEALRNEAE